VLTPRRQRDVVKLDCGDWCVGHARSANVVPANAGSYNH